MNPYTRRTLTLRPTAVNDLTFLVVGAGSMGRRRIRHLVGLGARNIHVWDIRPERIDLAVELFGVTPCAGLDEIVGEAWDAVIVSTPPDQHAIYAQPLAARKIPVFVEASVVKETFPAWLAAHPDLAKWVVPSCTMRFDPLVRTAATLVTNGDLGRILHFEHGYGQNLNQWHPWEKPEDYYVSKRETGAAREIVPFELSWLTWIFGDIERVVAEINTHRVLGLDIDEQYRAMLVMKSGVRGTLHVEVVSPVAFRFLRVVGEQGTAYLDFPRGTIEWDRDGARRTSSRSAKGQTYLDWEEMYQLELEAFLAVVTGCGTPAITLAEDLRLLDGLGALEASQVSGRWVAVS